MRMTDRVLFVLVFAWFVSSCASSATLRRIDELTGRIETLKMRERSAAIESQRLFRLSAEKDRSLEQARRDLEKAGNASAEDRAALEARVRARESEARAANGAASAAKRESDDLAKKLDQTESDLETANALAEKERAESKDSWGGLLEQLAPLAALVPVGGSVLAQGISNVGRKMQREKQADPEALKAAIAAFVASQEKEQENA